MNIKTLGYCEDQLNTCIALALNDKRVETLTPEMVLRAARQLITWDRKNPFINDLNYVGGGVRVSFYRKEGVRDHAECLFSYEPRRIMSGQFSSHRTAEIAGPDLWSEG